VQHEQTNIPVRDLLEKISQLNPTLPETIQVRIESAGDVTSVHGVYRQVEDILRNLFVNAAEAIPGEGTITLRAYDQGDYVAIQVEDTGVGIPGEQQDQIFSLFYSSRGGLGFGLWSARHQALANGGELTVDSQPGKTVFTLRLPRGDDDERVDRV
jgi:signal transduction histidine kinase